MFRMTAYYETSFNIHVHFIWLGLHLFIYLYVSIPLVFFAALENIFTYTGLRCIRKYFTYTGAAVIML